MSIAKRVAITILITTDARCADIKEMALDMMFQHETLEDLDAMVCNVSHDVVITELPADWDE